MILYWFFLSSYSYSTLSLNYATLSLISWTAPLDLCLIASCLFLTSSSFRLTFCSISLSLNALSTKQILGCFISSSQDGLLSCSMLIIDLRISKRSSENYFGILLISPSFILYASWILLVASNGALKQIISYITQPADQISHLWLYRYSSIYSGDM